MASEADANESHARRAEQPLGLSRKVWRVGWEAPPKRSSLTTRLVFYTCQWRPATRNQKEKRSREKPERQRHPERKRQGGEDGVVETRGETLKEGNIKRHP